MKKYKLNFTFLLASILMFLYSLMSVLFAIILKYIIDSISTGNRYNFFLYLFVALLIILGEFLASISSRYYALKYVRKNIEKSKNIYYSYLLKQEKISQLDDDMETDMSMFSNNIDILNNSYYINKILLVRHISNFVLSIYAVIYLNWIVCLIAFITSFVPLIIPQIFKKQVSRATDNYSKASTKYLDFVSDSLLGINEVRSYNNQEVFSKIHNNENSNLEGSRAKGKFVIYFVNMLSSNFGSLTFLITIAVSGYFVIMGNLTIGAMISIIQLLNNMVTPLTQISSAINDINSSKNVVNKYNVTIDDDKANSFNIDSFEEKITISNLSYSYDDTDLLRNLNYTFEKNKKYAIVGESGSGKSTLAKLISGNLKGYSGEILIDGIELGRIDLHAYRDICRYIGQQPYIFKDSIENNIRFFSERTTNIDSILKLFNLEKLIQNVGLDKNITDTEGISGGQKQRIVLSRALFRNSPILILDEPTASLDFKNTEDILNSLVKIHDLTLIMITHEHDDNILRLFDEVINIDYVNNIN